jgi:RNA polymerase sigma factor (sigma-70 family)
MSGDLRIEVRFKNAVLVKAIEEAFAHLRKASYRGNPGILRAAANLMGVRYPVLQDYCNLKLDPRDRSRDFKPSALAIAEALGAPASVLFPDHLYAGKFGRNLVADCDGELLALSSPEARRLVSEEGPDQEATWNAIQKALSTLTPREEKVLKMRFGLDGYEQSSSAEVGAELGVTRTRIQQIQNKAMGKLRHPVRVDRLHRSLEGE